MNDEEITKYVRIEHDYGIHDWEHVAYQVSEFHEPDTVFRGGETIEIVRCKKCGLHRKRPVLWAEDQP